MNVPPATFLEMQCRRGVGIDFARCRGRRIALLGAHMCATEARGVVTMSLTIPRERS